MQREINNKQLTEKDSNNSFLKKEDQSSKETPKNFEMFLDNLMKEPISYEWSNNGAEWEEIEIKSKNYLSLFTVKSLERVTEKEEKVEELAKLEELEESKEPEELEKLKGSEEAAEIQAEEESKVEKDEESDECEEIDEETYQNYWRWSDAKALYESGECHEAKKLFKKSAEAGYEPAMHYLGILYINGNGCKKSLKKATYWVTMAIQKGYEPAKKTLADITHEICKEQTNCVAF